MNAAYNCVDRWAFKHPDQTAILYEADEPGQSVNITYAELLREVSRVANVLKSWGVKKGDTVRPGLLASTLAGHQSANHERLSSQVSIYLPMTWQAAAAFLACARIGAVHSVVFAGFSAESLRDRCIDCECKVVITSECVLARPIELLNPGC